MGIKTYWHDENHTIIAHVFSGKWDLNDFYAAVAQSDSLMDTVDHSVNMILDVQLSKSIPSGFIATIRSVSSRHHANTGKLVMVGDNMLMQTLYNIFMRVYPNKAKNTRFYMAQSYEEAEALLARLEVQQKE